MLEPIIAAQASEPNGGLVAMAPISATIVCTTKIWAATLRRDAKRPFASPTSAEKIQKTPRPAPCAAVLGRLAQTKKVIRVVDRATEPTPRPSVRYGGAPAHGVVRWPPCNRAYRSPR